MSKQWDGATRHCCPGFSREKRSSSLLGESFSPDSPDNARLWHWDMPIPGMGPHSSMLTDQLLPYVWVPPGRAPSLSPWTMVTVRLQTPGSESGWANRARASPGPGKPGNQNCGLTASHLQSPLLEAHPGKKPDSSVFQISSPEPPGPCGSQQPTPSDFPCWPCPGDHHQGTMACPGHKTRMTWLSPQR